MWLFNDLNFRRREGRAPTLFRWLTLLALLAGALWLGGGTRAGAQTNPAAVAATGATPGLATAVPAADHDHVAVAPPFGLLAVYGALVFAAALFGGWIPMRFRLTHVRMQVASSLIAGLMLGVGLLQMLPHAQVELGSADRAAAWLVTGFLSVFFLQRLFHFHQHEVPEEGGQDHDNEAPAHEHDHGACSHAEPPRVAGRAFGWLGALAGLVVHNLMGALALVASVAADSHGVAHLAGVGVFLAIVLHKPFDSLTLGTLLARNGEPLRRRHIVNLTFAASFPIGMVLAQIGAGEWIEGSPAFLGAALAFSGGTFLCIAASDVLPELQFHKHDRFVLSAALLAGLGLALVIGKFDGCTHGHGGETPAAHAAEADGHAH